MHLKTLAAFAVMLVASATLAGCATVDFSHPELAAKWAKGGPAVASADYLKVYDNELTRLAAAAHDEDLSTARRLVACRDATVAEVLAGADLPNDCKIVASPPPTGPGGPLLLGQLIDQRLSEVIGTGYTPDRDRLSKLTRLKFTVDTLTNDLLVDQFSLDNARLDYAKAQKPPAKEPTTSKKGSSGGKAGGGGKEDKPFDTSCEALAKIDVASAKAAGADKIQLQCKALADHRNALLDSVGKEMGAGTPPDCSRAASVAGAAPIFRLYCEGWGSAAKSTAKASDAVATAEADLVTQLSKDVDAAKTANTANQDGLKTFGTNLEAALDKLPSGLAKVKALDQLLTNINAISRADVCNEQAAFDKATVTAAKCDAATPTAVETEASDTWAFFNALAMLSDANNPASRSAQWLAGAQAIIAAHKADAKLQAAAQKAQADAAQRMFNAWIIEANQDAKARLALCAPAPKSACSADGGLGYALAFYVDGENRGDIPAAVLAARSKQLEREYAVRRERAAADKEGQLLVAASNALDAGTKAGVDRDKLIGLLFDVFVAVAALSK